MSTNKTDLLAVLQVLKRYNLKVCVNFTCINEISPGSLVFFVRELKKS